MHSQSTNWTRNAILVLAPLTLIALLAVFVGPSLFGSSGDGDKTKLASANFSSVPTTPPTSASPSTTEPEVTPTPSETATLAVAAKKPKNLGTVKGTITIKGPKKVKAGTHVVFVVDGKKRQVVKDKKAPYALRLNTRKLPNGKYTVDVRNPRDGKPVKLASYRLTVKNPKPKPAPKPTPTSSAKPTTDKPKPRPTTPADKPTTKPPSNGGGSGGGTQAQQVLKLTNQERANAGCSALKLNSKLNAAAQSHSDDMAAKKYFSHDSQDGRSPFDRMSDAGYKFGAAAENIAQGYGDAEAVVKGWMNSEGHKANILNCTYTEMGLGWDNNYWTQTFGKPA